MSQNQNLNNNVNPTQSTRSSETTVDIARGQEDRPQSETTEDRKQTLPCCGNEVDPSVQHQSIEKSELGKKQKREQSQEGAKRQEAEQKMKESEKSQPPNLRGILNRNNDSGNPSEHKIFRNGDIIMNLKKNIQYRAIEMIGQGTFGQVLSVVSTTKNSNGSVSHHTMAMKIIKSQPAYINQGLMEIKNLREIAKYQQIVDRNGKNYLRLFDGFMWEGHLCIAMELLDNSILNILESSGFKGIEMKWIEKWAKELLLTLAKIHKMEIIHCDIKPQNIMFRPQQPQKPLLIDFSSSCSKGCQMFTYIQSRFYRSPEVLLGLKPYTQKVDIWSLGCVLAEMYAGLPIFPGGSAYDQMAKIWKLVSNTIDGDGVELIRASEFGTDYFFIEKEKEEQKGVQEVNEEEQLMRKRRLEDEQIETRKQQSIRLKTYKQYRQSRLEKAQINPSYFNIESLSDLLSLRNPSPKDLQTHELFIDLLKKMLDFNPEERISAEQAFLHPFIGGTFSELEGLRVLEDALEGARGRVQDKQ